MRNLDIDGLLAAIEASEIEFFYMLDLQTTAPVRITDRGIQIWYNGNKYTARDFLFADINHAAALTVDYMDIDIDDADGVITALALSEDIRKKWGILYIGVMVGSPPELQAVELLRGMVGEWTSEADNFRISFVNEFIYWKNCTKRLTSATCPWTFNSPAVRAGESGIGDECNYQGDQTTCDQSYERCVALGNTLGSGGVGGFGGFRFSIATADKVVWWGKIPK